MTDNLLSNNLTHTPPQFYSLSGKVPPFSFLFGIAAALAIGFAVGAISGTLEFLGHTIRVTKLIIILEVLIAGGTGAALGFILGRFADLFHSRYPPFNFLIVALSSSTALYAAWVAWSIAFVVYIGHSPPLSFIYNPINLFHFIQFLNGIGSWTIFNERPTGSLLAIVWIAEAVIIFIIACKLAHREAAQNVYCEYCKRWGNRRTVMQIKPGDTGVSRSELLARNFDALASAIPRSLSQDTWCNIALEGCSDCDNTQTLTYEHLLFKRLQKNQSKTIITPLIRRLILTPEQTARIAIIAASLSTESTPTEPLAAESPPADSAPADLPPPDSAA